jgi:hypothetical protein
VRKTAVVVLTTSLAFGGFALAPPDAAAASYTFSSCQQAGSGTPPAGLDELSLDVTGTAPASVVRGATFDVTGVSVVLGNPHAFPIEGSVIGFSAAMTTDSDVSIAGFESPTPFAIPAGGTFQFGGTVRYVASGLPGTVLPVRPASLHFAFGTGLSVSCTIAPDAPPFASSVVEDAPGYQYTCNVPQLGLSIPQTIDVVGSAPATAPRGSKFTLSNVVTTGAAPVGVTVLSTTFSLASPANATPLSPLSVTTPGPFTPPPGQPIVSPPMSFDFLASGPVGSLIEFLPGNITTELAVFGTVNCTLDPGQPAFASTTIVAPLLDEIATTVIRPGRGVLYAAHGRLTQGDFVFTRDAGGHLTKVTGSGTFTGPGGDAALHVRYERPVSSIRLHDPGAAVDLRASSFVPLVSPAGDWTALGLAFGRLGGHSVVLIWLVRDAG